MRPSSSSLARVVVFVLLLMLGGLLAACGEDEGTDDTGANTTPAATSAAATADTAGDAGEGEQKQWSSAPELQLVAGKDYGAVLHTSKGDIVVDLHESDASIAVNNFVFLARNDYYVNVPFHRIISGFMIQGGDPTGTGAGGPGYTIQDEPVVGEYTRGTMAMARTPAPNSAGSQFFIMHADTPLDKVYVIFGTVTEGMDVVDAIASVPVGIGGDGAMSSPLEPVTLESVEITEQ